MRTVRVGVETSRSCVRALTELRTFRPLASLWLSLAPPAVTEVRTFRPLASLCWMIGPPALTEVRTRRGWASR